MPELVSDARFSTNPDRVQHREELVELLAERLRARDSSEWHDLLTSAGVPAAPVADVADVVASPQTEALGLLQPVEHPEIPELRLAALPVSFDGERSEHRSPPPRVGEHTAAVLHELGNSGGDIAALAADSVVRLG